MGKGDSSNFKIEWDKGFSVPGAFILDPFQPIEIILFQKIFNFFSFILEGQFLLPQRANNGKGGIQPTSKLNETRGFQCLGHSNWTICSPLSPFCSRRFSTFSPSYWGANSYCPRGPIMGKGDSSNFKTEWDKGFSVPGHSNCTTCSQLSSWRITHLGITVSLPLVPFTVFPLEFEFWALRPMNYFLESFIFWLRINILVIQIYLGRVMKLKPSLQHATF